MFYGHVSFYCKCRWIAWWVSRRLAQGPNLFLYSVKFTVILSTTCVRIAIWSIISHLYNSTPPPPLWWSGGVFIDASCTYVMRSLSLIPINSLHVKLNFSLNLYAVCDPVNLSQLNRTSCWQAYLQSASSYLCRCWLLLIQSLPFIDQTL